MTVDSSATRDERLAELLGGLTEELRRGGKADVEAVARQHPDLAKELRELWAAVALADELARTSSVPPTLPSISATLPDSMTALPRSFGDYELLETLGRGGMGIVYKAHQRSLNRIVALKTMRGDTASAADLSRFRAEPGSAARRD